MGCEKQKRFKDGCLVLKRKLDEKIFIGDDIIVTVSDIQPLFVRLAINAPAHISIHREEVYLQIKQK